LGKAFACLLESKGSTGKAVDFVVCLHYNVKETHIQKYENVFLGLGNI